MKNILILLFLVVFAFKISAQESATGLPEIKSLKTLDSKNYMQNSKSESNKNSELPALTLLKKSTKKPSKFRFDFIPYFWAAGIMGTVSVPGIPSPYPDEFNINVKFSEAIKNIKMGVMGKGNFRYKQVALLYDIVYLNLKNFNATRSNGYGIYQANTTNKEFLADIALSYFIPTKSPTIFPNVYAGARITSITSEVTVLDTVNKKDTSASGSFTWVDPIIGVNCEFNVDQNWYSYVLMDVGGFGINSHFSLNFVGGVGYRFSKNWDTSLGYKVLGTNYHKKNQWDVSQQGFLISLGYRFM